MKKLLFASLFIASSFQSPIQEKKLKFEFTNSEMGVIYKALQEIPFKEANPVIISIEMQYAKQMDTIKKK